MKKNNNNQLYLLNKPSQLGSSNVAVNPPNKRLGKAYSRPTTTT
jgi:hypothetical protein